jgi:hypothetical protein
MSVSVVYEQTVWEFDADPVLISFECASTFFGVDPDGFGWVLH